MSAGSEKIIPFPVGVTCSSTFTFNASSPMGRFILSVNGRNLYSRMFWTHDCFFLLYILKPNNQLFAAYRLVLICDDDTLFYVKHLNDLELILKQRLRA